MFSTVGVDRPRNNWRTSNGRLTVKTFFQVFRTFSITFPMFAIAFTVYNLFADKWERDSIDFSNFRWSRLDYTWCGLCRPRNVSYGLSQLTLHRRGRFVWRPSSEYARVCTTCKILFQLGKAESGQDSQKSFHQRTLHCALQNTKRMSPYGN